MEILLPNIDKVSSLDTAKQLLKQLYETIEDLVEQHRLQNKRIQQLEHRLKKDKKLPKTPVFPNKNHSTDKKSPLKKKRKSWSKRMKKKSIEIDNKEEMLAQTQCICGCSAFSTIRTHKKVVQDIKIVRNNTEYTFVDQKCTGCGKEYTAQIPEDIKGLEFGTDLRTLVSMLKYDFRGTHPIIHRFLTGFGIQISTGQISNIIMNNSKKLTKAYSALKTFGVQKSEYNHTDTTSTKRRRKDNKLVYQNLHFFGHNTLSYLVITAKRNTATITKILGKKGLKIPIVADDAGCYGKNLGVFIKQLCWIHENRHFKKLEPTIPKYKKELELVRNDLWDFYKQLQLYRKDPNKNENKRLNTLFDTLVSRNVEYPKLQQRLKLTANKKERLLAFLDHPNLPIQNNLAERDLREAVIIRKISRETKSKKGDRSMERHLSVIQTARKRNLNIYETLKDLLIGKDPMPLLITT